MSLRRSQFNFSKQNITVMIKKVPPPVIEFQRVAWRNRTLQENWHYLQTWQLIEGTSIFSWAVLDVLKEPKKNQKWVTGSEKQGPLQQREC